MFCALSEARGIGIYMKNKKKRYKVLTALLLSMDLLMSTLTVTHVEARKKERYSNSNTEQKAQVLRPDHTNLDQNQDSGNYNSQAIGNCQVNPGREQTKQWNDYLGLEEQDEKGMYFQRLPFGPNIMKKIGVKVEIVDHLPEDSDSLIAIRGEAASDHSYMMKVRDPLTLSDDEVSKLHDEIIQFVANQRAEEDSVYSSALVEALKKMQENPQRTPGRDLFFPAAWTNLEEPPLIDNDFINTHRSDVQDIVVKVFKQYFKPDDRTTLEIYAPEMLDWVKQELLEVVEDNRKDKNAVNLIAADIINQMSHIYIKPENVARKQFNEAINSLKLGWENKVLKTFLDRGLKIKVVDYPLIGINGFKSVFSVTEYDMSVPFCYIPEEDTLYLRLGFEKISRATFCKNNPLKGVGAVLFQKYDAHLRDYIQRNIQHDESFKKRMEEEHNTFVRDVLEKRKKFFSKLFGLKNHDDDSLATKYLKAHGEHYLSSAFVIYCVNPTKMEKELPETFKLINYLVKKFISPEAITKNDIDAAIKKGVLGEFVRNESDLPPWVQQRVREYKQKIEKVDINILKKLAQKGARLHFIPSMSFDYPFNNKWDQYLFGISNQQNTVSAFSAPFVTYRNKVIYGIVPENRIEPEIQTWMREGKVAVIHEIGHLIEQVLYPVDNKPHSRPEVTEIMRMEKQKGVANRLFGDHEYPYTLNQEFLVQSIGYYFTDDIVPGGDKSFHQVLRDNCPLMYNFIKKMIQEVTDRPGTSSPIRRPLSFFGRRSTISEQ